MRHNKYITSQILLGCLSKPVVVKDIHAQLAETIAERKRITREMEEFTRMTKVVEMYLSKEKRA